MADTTSNTIPATSDRSASLGADVSNCADRSAAGISRRRAMNMITAITAAPAAFVSPITAKASVRSDRRSWDMVMRAYECAKAEAEA